MTNSTGDDVLPNEAATIAALADMASEPRALEIGVYYVVRNADGDIEHIDLTVDEYRDRPRRKIGTAQVTDPASFLAYWQKHSTDESEIYANRPSMTIIGVIDAHDVVTPGWGEHRIVLRLNLSRQFKVWQEHSGMRALMSQTDFAEFVQDNASDIRSPDAATMLEMAQTFEATRQMSFRSAQRLKDGQRQLTYVENTDAVAGQRGDIVIPDMFTLGLPVFVGAEVADQVTARLRYRIGHDGTLKIGYILDKVDEVVEAAFAGVVGQVDAGVTVPVFMGTPAGGV